jgi:hypothetical protein
MALISKTIFLQFQMSRKEIWLKLPQKVYRVGSSCKRVFSAALHNKTEPIRMGLSALSDYNTGYSLEETAKGLKKKTDLPA